MSPGVAAEAAVWVARLHGPDRCRQMERECLAWQARSAEHRLAFERCTQTWQEVPGVTLGDAFAVTAQAPAQTATGTSGPSRLRGRRRFALALSLAGLVMVSALSLQRWRGMDSYSTGVGEQQLIVLDDGTRMSLNTATRVRVNLGATQRTVDVEEGEALFEVAKDARRPFVVRASGNEVVALGTVFSVRLTPQGAGGETLAVTLIEGRVSVGPEKGKGKSKSSAAPERQLLLQPGERARLHPTADGENREAAPQVDRPRIEQVVAWRRGEAVFDDVSLAEAVAEMNRYSRTAIVLDGDAPLAALAGRRVSGQFRTGGNAGFARAVAALHGLVVRERQGRLELTPGS